MKNWDKLNRKTNPGGIKKLGHLGAAFARGT